MISIDCYGAATQNFAWQDLGLLPVAIRVRVRIQAGAVTAHEHLPALTLADSLSAPERAQAAVGDTLSHALRQRFCRQSPDGAARRPESCTRCASLHLQSMILGAAKPRATDSPSRFSSAPSSDSIGWRGAPSSLRKVWFAPLSSVTSLLR